MKSIRELIKEAQDIREQIDALCIKRNKKEFTEEDAHKMAELNSRLSELTVQIDSSRACEKYEEQPDTMAVKRELGKELKEAIKRERTITYEMNERDAMMAKDVTSVSHELFKGIIPPLREKSLLSQLGVTWETGIQGGKPTWATYNKAEAEIIGEGVRAKDKKIEFQKIEAKMRRMAITFTLTNQAIHQADVDLVNIVIRSMYNAIDEKLATWLCAEATFEGIDDFPLKDATKVTHTGALDYAALLKLEEAVYSMDIRCDEAGVYLMNPKDYYKLKPVAFNNNIVSTSIASLEQGFKRVLNNGAPVVITNGVKEGTIHYGIWSKMYALQYDTLRFISDPYTYSKEDMINFVLNGDFDIRALEPKYFATLKVTAGGK